MIIFTDLDGTLLDHETYSLKAARPALGECARRGIPVVPATSKTAAEVAPIMQEAGLSGPAIVENGAGITWPGSEAGDRSQWQAIRDALEQLPDRLRRLFEGFGDWTVEEVSVRTGLPEEAARLAKQRNFSEPGIFTGDAQDEAAFVGALAAFGIEGIRGGRFLTLSHGLSKASRMHEVCTHLGASGPVVALGDAPNDVAMLQEADIGIVVANPAHAPLPALAGETAGKIVRTTLAGPEGWNQAVLSIIEKHAETGKQAIR